MGESSSNFNKFSDILTGERRERRERREEGRSWMFRKKSVFAKWSLTESPSFVEFPISTRRNAMVWLTFNYPDASSEKPDATTPPLKNFLSPALPPPNFFRCSPLAPTRTILAVRLKNDISGAHAMIRCYNWKMIWKNIKTNSTG